MDLRLTVLKEIFIIMTKKLKLLSVYVLLLFILTSCVHNSAIVMPFEATFHKYIYTLTKDLNAINTETEDNEKYCKLIENDKFSVLLNKDTLVFYNKDAQKYYDSFGNEFDTVPETGLNISIKNKHGFELNYIDGQYYNSESDSYIDTLTAYELSNNSIRLLIVTGIEEFDIIGKTPLVLTKSFTESHSELYEYYSSDEKTKNDLLSQYPLLSERLDLTEDIYYLEKDIPYEKFSELGLTKNTAREEALLLNYDFSQVKMILTTVDITLTDTEIVFDLSSNRQYRSEFIRDKSFDHNIFEFDLDFVLKTESESEKITNAQSKY